MVGRYLCQIPFDVIRYSNESIRRFKMLSKSCLCVFVCSISSCEILTILLLTFCKCIESILNMFKERAVRIPCRLPGR